MGELSAQAKGIAKEAATVVKGRTGIYATLAREHGEVSSLMKQALEANTSSKRNPIVAKIRLELLSHAHAEEKTLYQALADVPATRSVAAHSKDEHKEIEELLRQVVSCPAASGEEDVALEKLQTLVEHHAKEEENDVFVQAQDALSSDDAKALDAEFKRLKEQELKRLEQTGQA